jgi:hypothetical protein
VSEFCCVTCANVRGSPRLNGFSKNMGGTTSSEGMVRPGTNNGAS